jgi:tetratricopeptide (TPR) repeat protein
MNKGNFAPISDPIYPGRKMAAQFAHTRRRFRSDWDEIQYLREKILHWFYGLQDRPRALKYSKRLEKLLRKASPDHQAILGEECWSLIYELKEDLVKAIRYREREIKLIKRLRTISRQSPSGDWVLQYYDVSDLSDRLDLLAILIHDSGDLDRAIEVLQESKRLCKSHDIPFDGADLLDDYLSEREKRSDHQPIASGTTSRPKRR